MADTFKFELVTPERMLMSQDAARVVVPGMEGRFTVLPGHAPVISALRPGVIELADTIIDNAATEVDPDKRKALYGDFVRRANAELPIWTPIEQLFLTVISAKARNNSNTPRWGSSSWHDLWLAE